jgi:hypothetical protein
MLAMSRAPGTIPGTVNPPKPNFSSTATSPQEEPVVAVAAPATSTRVATAAPAEKSGGFFANLGRKMGMGTAETTATTPPPQATASVAPATTPATPPSAASRLKAAVTRFVPGHDASKDKSVAAAKPAEPAKPAETKVAATRPALKPSVSDGAADGAQMAGAAPVVSSNSFDSRFGAMK